MSKPIPLEHGKFYHIYNRGINGQSIFYEDRNYRYFLRLYMKHVLPIADTFAYSLLGNHFHVSLRIKTVQELTGVEDLSGHVLTPRKPHQHFSNMFNAYTRSFNNAYGRTGALFERPFERKPVKTKPHLLRLITYIHQNPQHHGLVEDFRDWPYSSYGACLTSKPTRVDRERVLGWFDGPEAFVTAHNTMISSDEIMVLLAEDFE